MTTIERIQHIMELESIGERAIETRRYLHRHAELSEHEYGTMEYIAGRLEALGIPCRKGIAETGVVGLIEGSRPGPVIGLRADIDALPILEKNVGLAYASENLGVMHACGHDAHTAILLGTAELLCRMKEELRGSVKLFFQPAEESIGGAERMIAEGVLENPHVDAIFGLHVANDLRPGQIGCKYGKMYAASDMLTVKIHGKSCHGAHPSEGVDAILIAAQILNACQSVVSRNVAPEDSAVCTFGTIRGGNVRNQVADYVEMTGILRTLTPETRLLVRKRVRTICLQTAELMGGSAEFLVEPSYSPLINTDSMVDQVKANASALLGADQVFMREVPSMGVEDFAYFAAARPACFFHLGAGTGEPQHDIAHSCFYDLDESCIPIGIRLQALNVLNYRG